MVGGDAMGKRTVGAVLFVIGLMSVTTGAVFFQQAGSGMVGFWRLEESASPSMDSSGNNHTSAAWPAGVTSSTLTPAALGANSARCVDLNGTTGMVTFPTTSALNLTGDFTVCIWVFKRTDNADWVRIIGKGAEPIRTFGVWEEPGA